VQRIRFGLDLDGERGWHPRDALGDSTLGPLGLLNVLETQLGLTRAAPSTTERILQMRACLAAAANGHRFYENSFSCDELGTAATLLAWSDLWYEHGWDGTVTSESTARLRDMSAIAVLAQTRVFPGIGQRLNEIAAQLPTRRPQIECVEHVEPLEEYPLAWRRVLDRLPATGVATPAIASALPVSLLHELQTAALRMTANAVHAKLPWRDDGSVRIVRAESTLAAAQWLASQARSAPDADRVFVIEQSGGTLDAAMGAMDQPLLGASYSSAFRPTLQLLTLVLRLLWEPLDFTGLMQFLTHPIGPIRVFARRTLAEKIASFPGVGGTAWREALETIEAHYGNDSAAVLAEIAFWLESPRHAANALAPIEFIAARAARLAQFFQQHMADPDGLRRASSAAGFAQATALAKALTTLQHQGVTGLAAEVLDRLVIQATASGCDNPLLRAEAAARCCVRSPGALIESFDEVWWWHMAAVPLPKPYPWSPRELNQLRGSGVDLPSTSNVLKRQARSWLRPLLSARHCLTLMLPRSGEETHPAWLTLSSLLERPTVFDVENLLSGDGMKNGSAPIPGIAAVPHRPLAQRRRWWQIPAGAIHGWDRAASYSSLDQFFNNPVHWAMNYPAQLKSSSVLELPDNFRLLGNLAHRLVEQLYRHPDALSWSTPRLEHWFDDALERIVREEGALLLMRGRRAQLEAFRLRFRISLVQLHEHLRAAGAISVEPEKYLEGATPLGALRGSSDLVVILADARQVIIDMKWSGNTKYRDKLRDQTHVQLAIYARLLENNTSAWPAVGYFILQKPELLTTSDAVFPGVTPILVPGRSTAMLWDQIMATWQWRRTQIEAGSLECVLEGLEPTTKSQPPAGAIAIEELNPRYNACVNLMGWDEGA
jgi:hypothetical protein